MDNNLKATDIIQEVDFLKAISWIIYVRGEVSDQTVISCFHKYGIGKERSNVQVLHQEEGCASLVKELPSDVSPSDSIDFDMEASVGCFSFRFYRF